MSERVTTFFMGGKEKKVGAKPDLIRLPQCDGVGTRVVADGRVRPK